LNKNLISLHITKDNYYRIKNFNKVLFLGKWCVPTNEKIDHNFVPHPLSIHDVREDHYNFIDNEIDHLLPKITKVLNSFHQINFSTKSWETLLGHYILTISHIIYVKWLLIQNALKEKIDIIVLPVFKDKSSFVPKDLIEYSKIINEENFYSFLTSELIKKINIDVEMKKYYPKNFRINNSDSIIQNLFSNIPENIFNKINGSEIYFFKTSINKFDELFIKINPRLNLFINPLKRIIINEEPNYQLRNELKSNNYNSFRKILYEMIWDFLPVNYLEGFQSFNKRVQKQTKKFNPKVIVTSMSGIMEDDVLALYLAIKDNKRPKVVSLQHGGLYGTGKYNSVEKHEINVSDHFFTWGWKTDHNVVPSYIHKHLRQNEKSFKGGSHLIIINYSWAKHDYRISPTIMSTDMEKYIDNQISFIRKINAGIKRKLRVRFYTNDYEWGTKARIKKELSDSQFSTKSFNNDLKRARIIVPTYNSTTILESIALNIPTVALFDPMAEKYNKDAAKYFKQLVNAKILHYDYKSAADFINLIWDDVGSWWNSVNVEKAKASFTKQYANLPENSLLAFRKQLREIIN